jgi:hypothetical protein
VSSSFICLFWFVPQSRSTFFFQSVNSSSPSLSILSFSPPVIVWALCFSYLGYPDSSPLYYIMSFLRQVLTISYCRNVLMEQRTTEISKWSHSYCSDCCIVVLHQAEYNLQTRASKSHVSLCVEIKTINGRGKNKFQAEFLRHFSSHLSKIPQPKYFLITSFMSNIYTFYIKVFVSQSHKTTSEVFYIMCIYYLTFEKQGIISVLS